MNDINSNIRDMMSHMRRVSPGEWLRYPEHAWHALLVAFVAVLAILAVFSILLAGRVKDEPGAAAKGKGLAPLVTRTNLTNAFDYLNKKSARTAYLKAAPPAISDPSR